ncbi:MAG: hypothetical protein J4F40_02625 [Alphaproteobacteria bacterium]|nr:hypothetical protein [Alphaproteobacteria bacterium]MCY4496201.1 hypothetical protein [Rhodospirillaceae bacterium]
MTVDRELEVRDKPAGILRRPVGEPRAWTRDSLDHGALDAAESGASVA